MANRLDTSLPSRKEAPRCGRCGYDLTGLSRKARCPECGVLRAAVRLRDANSLARSSYRIILGVVWREVIAFGAHLGLGMLVISLIWTFPIWILLPLSLSPWLVAWFRCSSAMQPPESLAPTRRMVRKWILVVSILPLAFLAVSAVMTDASVAGSMGFVAFALAMVVGAAAAIFASRTAWWMQDDVAEMTLESAPWCYLLMLIGLSIVAGSYLFQPWTTVGDFAARARFPIFLGAIGWWMVVVYADLRMLLGAIQSLSHRAQYDDIERRRADRQEATDREFDARFRDMDGG
jgi:hypothetical protein